MATFRKRGNTWQVQVRRVAYPPIAKTFQDKRDAICWAREQERAVDRGESLPTAYIVRPQTFLSEIFDRYEAEVSSCKRSLSDRFHLRPIRAAVGHKATSELTPADLAAFRDARLKAVSSSTVRKEVTLLISVLTVANREWGETFLLDDFKAVRKPLAARGRDRRIEPSEWSPLMEAVRGCRNPLVSQVFQFALTTGMRRGEVLSLTWPNIDFINRVAFLPMTKNGEARRVPLSSSAMQELEERLKATQRTPEGLIEASCEQVFPISANAVRLAWERVRQKAGVKDLRFHDLRHEAISRFFEIGLSVPEVALISGHKDARMLFRYTQLRAENVAQKLG
jgi:integrase